MLVAQVPSTLFERFAAHPASLREICRLQQQQPAQQQDTLASAAASGGGAAKYGHSQVDDDRMPWAIACGLAALYHASQYNALDYQEQVTTCVALIMPSPYCSINTRIPFLVLLYARPPLCLPTDQAIAERTWTRQIWHATRSIFRSMLAGINDTVGLSPVQVLVATADQLYNMFGADESFAGPGVWTHVSAAGVCLVLLLADRCCLEVWPRVARVPVLSLPLAIGPCPYVFCVAPHVRGSWCRQGCHDGLLLTRCCYLRIFACTQRRCGILIHHYMAPPLP